MKYNLVGIDGNAFSVLGCVTKAMRKEHAPEKQIQKYLTEAMSKDYNHLLWLSVTMIDVCNTLNLAEVDWDSYWTMLK